MTQNSSCLIPPGQSFPIHLVGVGHTVHVVHHAAEQADRLHPAGLAARLGAHTHDHRPGADQAGEESLLFTWCIKPVRGMPCFIHKRSEGHSDVLRRAPESGEPKIGPEPPRAVLRPAVLRCVAQVTYLNGHQGQQKRDGDPVEHGVWYLTQDGRAPQTDLVSLSV